MKRNLTFVTVVTGVLFGLSTVVVQAQSPSQSRTASVSDGASTQAKPASQSPTAAASEPAPQIAGTPKPAAKTQKATSVPAPPTPIVAAPPVTPPPGYVIGPDDVLQVLYWREKDVSAEVTVRPDGMISLPLLNDVKAQGLTPEQLRDKVNELATKYFEDPNVTITIKTINSRRVYITGGIAKPGPYLLTAPTTVLQLIAMAGGLTEFADQKKITIMRVENGVTMSYLFNYKDVARRKNLRQNIELKPGDTVIVP